MFLNLMLYFLHWPGFVDIMLCFVCVCVHVCVCKRACMRVCVHALCVHSKDLF